MICGGEDENWSFQTQLDRGDIWSFDVHEMHSGKKKKEQLKAAVDIASGAVDIGYSDTSDRDCVFDSLSVDMPPDKHWRYVDSCGSICRQS